MGFINDIFGAPDKVESTTAEANLGTHIDSLGDIRDSAALSGINAAMVKDASKDRTASLAGKANADFWQGVSKQNLSGVMNPANRANLGSQLGNAYNVMDSDVRKASSLDQVQRQGAMAGAGVDNLKHATSALSSVADNAFAKEMGQTQDAAIRANGSMNMISSGLSTGVSAYTLGKEGNRQGWW